MVELMDSYSEIYEIAHTYVHILDQLNRLTDLVRSKACVH